MKAVISLDQEASDQAIESATRTHAQVVLESPAFSNTTINGFLISGDDKTLLMEITGHPLSSVDGVLNAHCVARVYGEHRYEFSTTITDIPRWGRSALLAFARPKVMGLIERRRFIRAKLAPSSQVHLVWRRAGTTHTHRASLLNISPDGLACRLDDDAAAAIGKDDPLEAIFEIPGRHQLFDLRATVKNATPASKGATILGIQFTAGPEAAEQLAALREFLETPANARPVMEACV
ncbi:MAG TPA: PilZ domain-containing protein [Phycisphaerae bacterium]|nr:PilZ domain-containing protein [Phycisphaerae bacterium]